MIAYHNDPDLKGSIIAQLEAHKAADQIIKGQYWDGGKGCAVGCTVHGSDHMLYESLYGIPVMLARLEDTIFEGLPNGKAAAWPLRFMGAIKPGVDLSLVGWKFQHWLLTDEKINPGINHPLVRDAVKKCADVLVPLIKGSPVDESAAESARSTAESAESAESAARSAAESARSTAESARSAAWSAAEAAESAESAARSAAWSARSTAESAARSAAEAAGSAAWSAAWSARSAESAAEAAAWSARSAAYVLMADKLVELIEAAA